MGTDSLWKSRKEGEKLSENMDVDIARVGSPQAGLAASASDHAAGKSWKRISRTRNQTWRDQLSENRRDPKITVSRGSQWF
jgi:hypothetical protein